MISRKITGTVLGRDARAMAADAGIPIFETEIEQRVRTLPDEAWRETTEFEGQIIEAFAHDPGTLRYFCREVDRPSGLTALP